jgi:perosamine synthetase
MIIADDFIPVAGPSITEREPELAAEAARTAWYGNHNTFNQRFEALLAAYVGVRHAVSLPHATAGLHLALAALDIGKGDEVIAPAVTWIASVAPIVYVGAEPVLVDIDPVTWCIDPSAVEAAITPRTRAIIGVDLYGSVCDWDALRAIARRRNLALIEDAAEALGSRFGGKAAGALGDVAVFSFHGSKTVVTGEGGMLVTDGDDIHARVLKLRDHGRPPGDRLFLNEEIAFKYKMSAMQAAVGVAQMERIDSLVEQKRAIFRCYADRLSSLSGVTLNAEPPGTLNSYWMVTAVIDEAYGLSKFDLMAAFLERRIDTRPFFSYLPAIPAFANRPEAARFLPEIPRALNPATYGINLPSGYHMIESKIDLVCRAFEEILGRRPGRI